MTTPKDDKLDNLVRDIMQVPYSKHKAKAAIQNLINQKVLEGREEQVMRDFGSLNVSFDGCVDERELIMWRDDRLNELKKESK